MAKNDFQEWLDEFESSGGVMSSYDKSLAYQNQNFAQDIMAAKDLYYSGGDAGAANRMAENARIKYGNYTGGAEGSEYNPLAAQPVYSSTPDYSSQYTDQINSALDKLLNRSEFSYNPAKDPAYTAYSNQYTRAGQRAMEDTMGSFASMTGGLPSSAAVSAGQQAQNLFMSEMTGVIPELMQAAYGRYSDDYSRDLSALGALMDVDQVGYGRYRDSIGDTRYADETAYNRGIYADETAYARSRDAISDARYEGDTAYARAADMLDRGLTTDQIAANLGITPAQAQEYARLIQSGMQANIAATNRSNTAKTGGTGSGGGSVPTGSGGDVAGIFEKMKDSGSPLAYLQANYKSLGIAYSGIGKFYEGYLEWTGGGGSPAGGATVENRSGDTWIEVDGYRYSRTELERYIESGQIVLEYDPEKNTIRYEWAR